MRTSDSVESPTNQDGTRSWNQTRRLRNPLPIGAGGVGKVYKARDVRLDRTVAIKVLPAHLSENAQLRQRFEQEARAVSSLNQPQLLD